MKMKEVETLQDIGMQFNESITRIKHSQPLWADLLKKSTVFLDRLRLMSTSYSDYLDSLQRIVDVAQWQEGGAKDLAPILSKMYVKQRNMEAKLENLCKVTHDSYSSPMKEKLKEWKETCDYLDTKHTKEGKRRLEEVKKAVIEAGKLKKKVMKKGKTKKQGQLSDAERSKESMLYSLQQFEQHALRGALIEERAHYCTFVKMMVPAWELECELMDDGTHLRDVMTQAVQVAALPTKLPVDAEQCIHKIRLVSSDTTFESSEIPNISNNAQQFDGNTGPLSPRTSFISTNSSSTSGVSSGGSFSTLPNSPQETTKTPGYKYSSTQFSSFDNLARSYPASDQTSAYGSSPSVCQTTRGIVADINKFVEQSQDEQAANIPLPDKEKEVRKKTGSGDYTSLSPLLNRNSFEGETYENLGDMITTDGCIDVDKATEQKTEQKPPTPKTDSPVVPDNKADSALSLEQEEEEEPLYENIADQTLTESIYDVPPPQPQTPPQPPPVRSASLLCRRSSANDVRENSRENTVNAYLERRRSVLSQNRSNTDLRGSNEYLHGSRHSVSHPPTQYASSRPASVCSNHSTSNHSASNHSTSNHSTSNHSTSNHTANNHNANNHSANSYYNSNGSINGPYSVQQYAAPPQQYAAAQRTDCYNRSDNPGYATRNEIKKNTNGGYAIQQLHNGYASQHHAQNGNYATQVQPQNNGYAAQKHPQNGNYPPQNGNYATQQTNGYATQQHPLSNGYATQHKPATIHRTDSVNSHYAVQQRRSESRLSLKSQPPHYATMTARPNKRTYSLTSLNQQYTSAQSLHNSTHSLHNSTHSLNDGRNNGKVLSAVDPEMPPPPPPEVGQELSELCQQITKGGTLRPSQMRMMGMKQGDTSTIKRRDTRTPDNNFDVMVSSINQDIQHLNLTNK